VQKPQKKGGRHVATAALSLGRKRPRRAYAAGHAAPQQYRLWKRRLQELSAPDNPPNRGFFEIWQAIGARPRCAVVIYINNNKALK
jgi:hypothetical protein